MDRVQRSGLITLTVLLLTAVGAHFIGSRPGSEASIPERKVAQDPAAWEGVQFLPPEQRELFVGAAQATDGKQARQVSSSGVLQAVRHAGSISPKKPSITSARHVRDEDGTPTLSCWVLACQELGSERKTNATT